jgi:hypothetical protein
LERALGRFFSIETHKENEPLFGFGKSLWEGFHCKILNLNGLNQCWRFPCFGMSNPKDLLGFGSSHHLDIPFIEPT